MLFGFYRTVLNYYSKITITNCYNAGTIECNTKGGIIGYVPYDDSGEDDATGGATTTLTNCYFDSGSYTDGAVGNDEKNVFQVEDNDKITSDEMQNADFAKTLNTNVGTLSSEYLDLRSWQSIDDTSYPTFTDKVTEVVTDIELNSDGVYEIYTAAGLAEFRDLVNGEDEDINGILMDDIDLEGSASNLWTPIGTDNNTVDGYGGTFDGNGKTVTGLYVKDDTRSRLGLFGCSYGSTGEYAAIKNLTVGGYVESTSTEYEHLAIICGSAYYTTISNCSTLEGSVVVSSHQVVAGIAGYTDGCTISECTNRATVSADEQYAGGIVGYASPSENTIITNCLNYGDISSGSYVGGIAGKIYNNNIMKNSVNLGDVCGGTNYIGGLAGANQGGDISNSCSIGDVSGSDSSCENVGGIVGIHELYDTNEATLENCYSSGAVSMNSNNTSIGGVVGKNYGSQISNCYFNSLLYSGDAVGTTENNGTATNCEGMTNEYMTNGYTLLNKLNDNLPTDGETWVQGSNGYPIFKFVEDALTE